MKVLKGTAAMINNKLYKEGQSIPSANEEEFADYLVEVKAVYPQPAETEIKPQKSSLPAGKAGKKKSKK